LCIVRQKVHAFPRRNRQVVIAHHNTGTVLLNEMDALDWIRVVPDYVSKAVDLVHTDPFDGAESRLQRLEVGVNVGENSNSHGHTETRKGNYGERSSLHRAIYATHKEIPNRVCELRIEDFDLRVEDPGLRTSNPKCSIWNSELRSCFSVRIVYLRSRWNRSGEKYQTVSVFLAFMRKE